MTVLNESIKRPTDQELHDISIGSAGLYPHWWTLESPEVDGEGWEMKVSVWDLDEGEAGEGDPVDTCRLTADKIWVAALAIASGAVKYATLGTVRECQRLVYAGADACDFDEYTADQLLQTAVLGWPHYA